MKNKLNTLIGLSYKRYLEKAKRGISFFPSRVTIELTNKCNLECKMCPRNYISTKYGFMNHRLFKRIIDEIAHFAPITVVPFFRGESLLHPGFFELMAYAKMKKHLFLQLATNATLLDKKTATEILKLNLDFISFSLDSTKKQEYERLRRSSCYAQVLENINNFIQTKNEKRLKLPRVQISMVRTRENHHLVKLFIRQWINKADRVRVYYEHSRKGMFGGIKLANFSSKRRMPCLKPLTDIVVYWDGAVALCNHDWQRKEKIGTLHKATVEQIWNSPTYNKIRLMHYNNSVTDSVCKDCDQWMCYYLPEGIIGELYFNSQRRHGKAEDGEVPYTYNKTLLR